MLSSFILIILRFKKILKKVFGIDSIFLYFYIFMLYLLDYLYTKFHIILSFKKQMKI